MGDTMLIGALLMPMPTDPADLDIVTYVQFLDRAREAAVRIQQDAVELETLRAQDKRQQERYIHLVRDLATETTELTRLTLRVGQGLRPLHGALAVSNVDELHQAIKTAILIIEGDE